MIKKWVVAPKITEEFQNQFPTLSGTVLQLLHNRGLKTQGQIDEFLHPDYSQDIHDPFIFQDMEKAVKRIFQAINGGEKAVVYGDYDADGMSSSALLFLTLKELGLRNLEVYIPDREAEGYGLNASAVSELARQGTNLIITVDCGISNREEVKLAAAAGMDVIVTDHHQEPPALPEALALINPKLSREKYPFRDLAGVGVAFKLAQALISRACSAQPRQGGASWEGFEKWLLDLVAIGTVADRMEILGENRTLVKYGLVVLNKTRRVGLKALISVAGLSPGSLDTGNIGYQIGPRLNAAGRLNHTSVAYHILITDQREEAEEMAAKLEETNQRRQRIVEQITSQARSQVRETAEKKEMLFAVSGENDAWPVGVLGLVATKLSEEFNRPALVVGQSSRGLVGSGRVPSWHEEFNLIENLRQAGEFLSAYGGHAGACGFSLKNHEALEIFREKFAAISRRELSGRDLSSSLFIDAEMPLSGANWRLYEDASLFEPFGERSERPRFLFKNVDIVSVEKVGQTGNHLKIMVADSLAGPGAVKKLIGFGIGNGWGEQLKKRDRIDVVAEVGVNEWNGNRELQLKIIDLRESEG